MPVTHSPHDTSLDDPHASNRPPRLPGAPNTREHAADEQQIVRLSPRKRSFVLAVAWFEGAILAMLVVAAGFGFLKFKQVQAMQALAASGAFEPPPSAVSTFVAHPAQWEPTLHAVGSVEAVQGTTVSADLPGIVKEIDFESGKSVKKGDILVRLVTDQEQAQLDAAQAQRDLAVYNLKRQRDLREKNTNSQSDFDNAEANERQMEAMVSNARAAIDRKTIRASFDGVLGIRKVNLGQYLNNGDPVVALQSMDPIYVNFTLPQQNLRDLGAGSAVEVHTDATGDKAFQGKVTAINALVDEATRNFQAQATLANPDGKLRPGMFATVDVPQVDKKGAVLPIPSSAISYAPYGNSVFVVVKNIPDPKDKTKTIPLAVRQQFVKTSQTKGDLVAVTSGLKEGDEVVSSGVFKLQNSSAIQINNSVKPEAEENPHPEES